MIIPDNSGIIMEINDLRKKGRKQKEEVWMATRHYFKEKAPERFTSTILPLFDGNATT
jgi:hypothetical protein